MLCLHLLDAVAFETLTDADAPIPFSMDEVGPDVFGEPAVPETHLPNGTAGFGPYDDPDVGDYLAPPLPGWYKI